MKVYKMSVTSFLTALAVVLHYAESFIPELIPGFRLGLANIVSIFALFYMGPFYYVSIIVLRVLLVGLLFTGFGVSFMLSLAGAILSGSVSLLLYYLTKMSIYGISVSGAFFHVLGQILVYIVIVDTPYMLLYLPALSVSAMACGIGLALIAAYIIKVLPSFEDMAMTRRNYKR